MSLNAQTNTAILDVNNSSAFISNSGTVFSNTTNSTLGYEIPKGSGISAINGVQFWFAGKENNTVHTTFGGSSALTDVFHGPYSTTGNYTDPSYQTIWGESVWHICQSEIDQFVLWYDCANGDTSIISAADCANIMTPSSELLTRIINWPATNAMEPTTYFLAPFFDRNLDGMYNPLQDGDYPIIKGCCAVYMIQNDSAGTHTYTRTTPIGIEMHYMFYQYSTFDYLNDATFVDVMAINRGTTNYPEFTHGISVDADLGNPLDDFFGCDSTENLMYFYNGDNNDELNGQTNGYYGFNPPAIGIVSLENPISSCTPSSPATTASERWNLMNGKKANGTAWTKPAGNPTPFVYSGNPINSSDWSEVTASNVPGDRRAIMTTTDGAFNSGDTILESYAFIYSRTGNNLNNVQDILSIADYAQTFYTTQSQVQCGSDNTWGIKEIKQNKNGMDLYPNPSTGKFTISNTMSTQMTIEIMDLTGKTVFTTKTMNSTSTTIDISDKPKGVYFVKVITSSGESVKKIILQ